MQNLQSAFVLQQKLQSAACAQRKLKKLVLSATRYVALKQQKP
jgi:hypothetical protein